MGDVLVLDISAFPLGKVAWRRAMALLRKNKAFVVEYYEDWTVRTVSVEIKVPSIIQLLNKITGNKKAVKFSRQNIYFRDKGKCQYCNLRVPMPDMTLDHVLPRSQEGKTTWDNTVVACMKCNQKKANRTPQQAGMKLLSTPSKPKKASDALRFTFAWQKNMPLAWRPFLQAYSYWNGELEE